MDTMIVVEAALTGRLAPMRRLFGRRADQPPLGPDTRSPGARFAWRVTLCLAGQMIAQPNVEAMRGPVVEDGVAASLTVPQL